VNRADLQKLATERIADARALLTAKRWSGAYYLSGYAVESALKACIVVRLRTSDEFPDKRFSEQCWTHNLTHLMTLSSMKPSFDIARSLSGQERNGLHRPAIWRRTD